MDVDACVLCTGEGLCLLFAALDLVTSMKCISLSKLGDRAASHVPFKVKKSFI